MNGGCRYCGYTDVGPGDEAAVAAKKLGLVPLIKHKRRVAVRLLFRRYAAMCLMMTSHTTAALPLRGALAVAYVC